MYINFFYSVTFHGYGSFTVNINCLSYLNKKSALQFCPPLWTAGRHVCLMGESKRQDRSESMPARAGQFVSRVRLNDRCSFLIPQIAYFLQIAYFVQIVRLRENAKQPILPKWSSFIQWSMMVSIDESCNRIMLVIIILQEIHYMKNNVIFRIETVLIFENIKISWKSCFSFTSQKRIRWRRACDKRTTDLYTHDIYDMVQNTNSRK